MQRSSSSRCALPFTGADGLPILVYHKVGAYTSGAAVKAHYVGPALFRAHMSFLAAAGYQSVSVDELVRYVGGEALAVARPIMVTFDDGYDCVYRHAVPVLREFGLRALVFMLAGYVGGVNEWEQRRTRAVEPMLSAAHIAELARAGIEFGSHGMHHRCMTRLEPAQLRQELADSKRVLEDIVGCEVKAIAYPNGDYDHRVCAAAAQAGYLLGCTTERGVNRPGTDPFALRRINIRRYNYVPLFGRKLRRAYGIGRPRPT